MDDLAFGCDAAEQEYAEFEGFAGSAEGTGFDAGGGREAAQGASADGEGAAGAVEREGAG